MNIRLANMMDLPAVMKMLQQVVPDMHADGNFQWNDTYPNEAIFKEDVKAHNLFLAIEDGEVIGSVVINSMFPPEYRFISWKSSPNSFTFHRMMVHPKHRNKGVARALFQYIEYRGQLLGLKALRVDCSEKNPRVKYLLEKQGYVYAGKANMRGIDSDFLCYEKTLP